ncbi:unnamed protein product, partial [Nesidiocoris tenuis]
MYCSHVKVVRPMDPELFYNKNFFAIQFVSIVHSDDDNVWFVLEEDGGLKSIVKSAKRVADDDETVVYEESVAQLENEEDVDDVEQVASDQISTSVAYADDDGEYYEVYEDENGDDSNAVLADESGSKVLTRYVVQNPEEPADDPEPSKFGCGSSWTDDAVYAMLAQVEPLLDELKTLPPQKHREIWDKIGESLVPHQHSGMDCLLKFRNMKRALEEMALSNDRRERKENEIYTLLKTIVTEEEKKVDLFRKLLERL